MFNGNVKGKKQFFEYIIQFRYLIIIIKFKKQDLKQDYCWNKGTVQK